MLAADYSGFVIANGVNQAQFTPLTRFIHVTAAGYSLEFAIQVVRERGYTRKDFTVFCRGNVCELVKVAHFTNKSFADCCPHALLVLSCKNFADKTLTNWWEFPPAKALGYMVNAAMGKVKAPFH